MAWYSIVRQTQLTDIDWRNLNLSGELGSSPQKSQPQGRNVRWCEISKSFDSFVYMQRNPAGQAFNTQKLAILHMFSQRSVAQYGVILQGHQTWLARKASFTSMIFPAIYKPPWLEPFRYPFKDGWFQVQDCNWIIHCIAINSLDPSIF